MNETSDLCGLVPYAGKHPAVVESQRRLADGTYAIRLHCPPIARTIMPGQFFMIRPAQGTDPLLGRPFALYDTILSATGTPESFEFGYHVVGKMTSLMSSWTSGEPVVVWGPLGNGFPRYTGRHLLCVGGGIGYTPFLAVARETLRGRQYGTGAERRAVSHPDMQTNSPQVSFCYGVQSRRYRADLQDFGSLQGLSVSIATDDGSEGRQGFVTQLVQEHLQQPGASRPDGVYCCGPEPMMRAVAALCEAADVPCWLSLETPMACGFGACFSCVTKVRTEDAEGWDYRRTCVEGPVFRADALALAE